MRGQWTLLDRAVDERGVTIDFYLSPTRSAKAAKRFLGKAFHGPKDWDKPTKFNTDKAPSNGAIVLNPPFVSDLTYGNLDRVFADNREVDQYHSVLDRARLRRESGAIAQALPLTRA